MGHGERRNIMEAFNLNLDELIKTATEIGIQVGMEYIRKEKEARRKDRYDRRLRNTKLLLREYRRLKTHCTDAIYEIQHNPIFLLDEIDEFEYDDQRYINSIKESTERTATIISHVDKMLEIYRQICEMSKYPEEQRRYSIIKAVYLDEEEKDIDDIADEHCINKRTVYKDINKAVESLSALIFGVDGLKVF